MQFSTSPQNNFLTATASAIHSSANSTALLQSKDANVFSEPLQNLNRSSSNLSAGNSQRVDLNGDGRADLFWYNNQTGETRAWLMNQKGSPTVVHYGKVSPSSGWGLQGLGDFNGDGKTDLFWYNFYTGKTATWFMDGSNSPTAIAHDSMSPQAGWKFKGLGDFNGDGKTDLFWYNDQNGGKTTAWLMNGSKAPTIVHYSSVSPTSGWKLQGFSDLNGDGKTDVLWHNTVTDSTVAWLMNGNQAATGASLGTISPGSGWSMQGLGDFNGDGKADLFLYNAQTGGTQIRYVKGANAIAIADYGSRSAQNGWTFEGIGDFDGNGKMDLFWYNRQTGKTEAWLMNGLTDPTVSSRYQDISSYWDLQALGDFNGDGKTEVFWRNYGLSNAGTRIWSIGTNSKQSTASHPPEPTESGWQLISTNQMSGIAI
ncbi:VCBS repeat-containing protein [Kovacikia minuta CCNUW1]|uniref:FG-GAP repeat domain-containing protein n=1 Tax=Kovacikia minuta TaxID=2931930 RepID=UPI001CCADE69|nr:VCBS repeat-containing protein [Kovacikia minuta]UBF26303.1 VCBS repeat-containing protein [Kovacikia minuta CCNUW1]